MKTFFAIYQSFLKKYNKKDDENLSNDFFSLLYFYSKLVKNIGDFYFYRNKEIDFINQFPAFEYDMYLMAKKHLPVSLITRRHYFYGNRFFVTKGCLIPRSETELMVDKIVFDNYQNNLKILDLCAGVGNIGLSLAKSLNAKVTLVEKYTIPFNTLKINLKRLKLKQSKVKAIKKDVRSFLLTNQKKYDIVVMNPPYIAYKDSLVEKNVTAFEPSTALFTKNKGLYYYKMVLNKVPNLINEKLILYFEIGYNQKQVLINYLQKIYWSKNFNIESEFLKDYHNVDRIWKITIIKK